LGQRPVGQVVMAWVDLHICTNAESRISFQ
jgi:hypothetical protein